MRRQGHLVLASFPTALKYGANNTSRLKPTDSRAMLIMLSYQSAPVADLSC